MRIRNWVLTVCGILMAGTYFYYDYQIGMQMQQADYYSSMLAILELNKKRLLVISGLTSVMLGACFWAWLKDRFSTRSELPTRGD